MKIITNSANYPLFDLTFTEQILLGGGVVVASLIGIFLNLPLILIPAALSFLVMMPVMSRPFFGLILYISSIIGLAVFDSHDPGHLNAGEYLFAFIMMLAIAYVIYLFISGQKNLFGHPAYYWMVFYVIWSIVGGLISIAANRGTFDTFIHEIVTFSPLFIVPVLYREASKKTVDFNKKLFFAFVIFWAFIFIFSVYNIKNSLAGAVYVFQTRFRGVDLINSGMMLMVFLSLLSIEKRKKWKRYFLIGATISALAVVITFNRTAWIGNVLCLPLLVILSSAKERNVLIRYGLTIFSILAIVVVIAAIAVPLVKVIGMIFVNKFLSSTGPQNDASFMNRVVEWKYVFKQIYDTPIVGVGFGGEFFRYNWLDGFSTDTGYTHNGILLLWLKGGLVGLIAMLIAQIHFFILGLSLIRSKLLDAHDRIFIKVAVMTMILLFVIMQTVGFFIHRELLWYLGLTWAIVGVKYEKVKRLRKLGAVLNSND